MIENTEPVTEPGADLWVMSATGSSKTRLTDGLYAQLPTWGP